MLYSLVLLLGVVSSAHGQSGCVVGNRGQKMCFVVGDLTKTVADALVNAANQMLAHGGGIAGALSQACGPQLQADSDAIVARNGPIPVSETAVTSSYNLGGVARDIIHVVGPVYDANQDQLMRTQLRDAVWNVLRTARLTCDLSVALPPISSGIFGFPLPAAADTIMDAIASYYLYVYDAPDALLDPTLVAAGKLTGRFFDRTPCNATTAAIPHTVTLVAWAGRDAEGPAVQASWNRLDAAEQARRTAAGVGKNAHYTVAPTQMPQTWTNAPTSESSTDAASTTTTTTTAAADTSASSTTAQKTSSLSAAATTSEAVVSGSQTVATPEHIEYCGPLPLPCWSAGLFAGLLLACVLLLACSAYLCTRDRKRGGRERRTYRAMATAGDDDEDSSH
jgi:O-acetyl-ADP-ribose deacetylase (regulator of RNase III)